MPESFEQALPLVTAIAVLGLISLAAVVLRRLPGGRHDQSDAGRDLPPFVATGPERTLLPEDERLRSAAARLDAIDPVLRLPAVHGLEDLAQHHPALRQTVIDLLCGYLRREPTNDEPVRRAAQHVIAGHVRPAAGERYWGGVDVDLSGAALPDLDLSGAVIGALRCHAALIAGAAALHRARVLGPADFSNARFMGPLRADDTDFEQTANFSDATFTADASFNRCTFRGTATYAATVFCGPASFASAVFLARAAFSDPDEGPAWFHDLAIFRSTCFDTAQFDDVVFAAGADLKGGESGGEPLRIGGIVR